MNIIEQVQANMGDWIGQFDPANLKDKEETVFITIASFKNKTGIVGFASAQVNSKGIVYPAYNDGMILDKESTTHIVKISRQDKVSADEEVFIVTIVAESKHDSDMIANHITNCLMELLRERNLL